VVTAVDVLIALALVKGAERPHKPASQRS